MNTTDRDPRSYAPMASNLKTAVAWMRAQIADGGEYPDVEWAASRRFGIPSFRLRRAYDAQ